MRSHSKRRRQKLLGDGSNVLHCDFINRFQEIIHWFSATWKQNQRTTQHEFLCTIHEKEDRMFTVTSWTTKTVQPSKNFYYTSFSTMLFINVTVTLDLIVVGQAQTKTTSKTKSGYQANQSSGNLIYKVIRSQAGYQPQT